MGTLGGSQSVGNPDACRAQRAAQMDSHQRQASVVILKLVLQTMNNIVHFVQVATGPALQYGESRCVGFILSITDDVIPVEMGILVEKDDFSNPNLVILAMLGKIARRQEGKDSLAAANVHQNDVFGSFVRRK